MRAVEIIIAGLCTILNVKSEYNTLPEPSMIAVRTGCGIPHIPFVGWDSNKVNTTIISGAFDLKDVEGTTSGSERYFVLDGERLELNSDPQGKPDVTGYGGVASYFQYSRSPVSTNWDRCYIPKSGERPDKKCVAAFMLFGTGKLTTGAFTPFDIEFRDYLGPTTYPFSFPREVIYTTKSVDDSGYPSVTVALHDLKTDAVLRAIKFTAKQANADVQLFVGNDVEGDMANVVERWKTEPTPTSAAGLHFYALRLAVKNQFVGGRIPFRTDLKLSPTAVGGPGGG